MRISLRDRDSDLLLFLQANITALSVSVLAGIMLRYLVPVPAGLTIQAWETSSLFLSCIAGLVLLPLPGAAWPLTVLTAGLMSKAFTFQSVISSIESEATWIIVTSLHLAKARARAEYVLSWDLFGLPKRTHLGLQAFETSGLGKRIANLFVSLIGRTSLGLAYALALADLAIAPGED